MLHPLARQALALTGFVFTACVVHAAAAPEIELWPEGVPGLHADAAPTRVEN